MKKTFILSLMTFMLLGLSLDSIAQTQASPAVFNDNSGSVTFVDLSTVAGAMNLGQGDDVLKTVTLPFDFSIYGQTPTTCMDISTNGWIGDCGATSSDLGNSCPYPDPSNGSLPRIAVYHDDIDMEVGSVSTNIWVKHFPADDPDHPGHPTANGTCIEAYMIHYKDAQDFPGVDNPSPTQKFNFGAVLYADGSVAYLFADDMPNADQNSATTAIQGPLGASTLPGCNTTGYIQSDVYGLDAEGGSTPCGGGGPCFTIGEATGELAPVLKGVGGVCGPAAVPTQVCDCPTGYVAVGYEGIQGNFWGPQVLNQFKLRCKQLNQDGSLGNTVVVTCSNGSATNNNVAVGPVDAGANQAMVGGQLRIGCAIDAVGGFAKPMSEVIAGDPNSNNTQMAFMGGPGGSLGPAQFVPNGNVIVGMQGYEEPNNNISGGVAWRYAPIESCGGGGGGSGECNATSCVLVTCPDDVTVSCYEDYEIDPANVAAVFTCGSEAFRYVTQPHITGAPNCPGTTYVITYKVGDNMGNRGCCDQTITIDNAPPSITVPPGETVSCYEDIVVSNDDATVTESCNEGYELKILPPVLEGAHECPGTTYTYTYRVRDNCGREVIANRVFTIGNNAPPSIVAPPDMTVTCDFNANLNPDYAEVTTGCTLGYTTVVTGPSTSGTANCPGASYTYTYTVTDDCGRTASDVRTFTIANDAPVFLNCPSVPLQLNCEDEGWENVIQAWLASVQAESACGDALSVTNNYNPNSQGLCINNGTKIVRFFATDNCGRTSMCEGMVIIADTEAPIFITPPQDELVVCNYVTQDKLDAWVDAHGYAEVDDCWTIIDNYWTTSPNNPTINCAGNPGPTSLTVTFVVRDGCGNKRSMDATFTALPAQGGFNGSSEEVAEDHLQLFQNQPNPFSDETTISFYMPQAGKATLSIFDISGKLLKEISGDYNQGMNVEELNSSDLQPGMLYYQLSTADETATKRMILLD